MEDLRVVGVIYVCKDTEELAVDVFDGRGEGLGKVVSCDAPGKISLTLNWSSSSLTRFCGEDVLVVEQVLDPGHDVINIGGCSEVDTLSILVYPCVIKAMCGETSQK